MHKTWSIAFVLAVTGLGAHATFAATDSAPAAKPAKSDDGLYTRARDAGFDTLPKLPVPTAAEMKAIYQALSKLPDWSGTWVADPAPSILDSAAAIPLTAKFAAKLDEVRKSGVVSDKPAHCQPYGMPIFMQQQGPTFSILFAPGRVVMESGYHEGRVIYTDGRKVDPDPGLDFFDGNSVGHWQGDTLLVDTDGIIPASQVLPGITGSQDLRVSERIRLVGPDKLQDVITLTDPGTFTKPYTYTRTLTRHRELDVTEYDCLLAKSVNYGINLKMTAAEQKASTIDNPPVREIAKPAPNAASLPGGTWESIAQLPDFVGKGGLWTLDRGQPHETYTKEVLPFKPVYAKRFAELREILKNGGDLPTNNYHCWPRGPYMEITSDPLAYFVYTPGQVTLITGDASEWWRIYTDGRGHPDNLVPSFYGHSIGHWEGDTLVADTVGFRADVQMTSSVPNGGHMHMTERFHQTSPGKMTVDVTTMSDGLTSPWHYQRTFTMLRALEPMERYCAQNNRDIDPKTGYQTFSLTPPPQ